MDIQGNIVIKTKTAFARKVTFLMAFFLLMIILPVGFVDEKSARVAFYLCGYTSSLGLLLDYKKIRTFILNNKHCYPFIALSILFFTWSVIYKFHEYPHEADGTLFTPAKRWFFSCIISIFLISNCRENISGKENYARLALISLFSSFIISSSYGIWQKYNGTERILLGIDRATLAAYIYSALSLTVISFLIRTEKPLSRWILLIPAWLISVCVIIATGTRAAIFIHTLISFGMISSIFLKNKNIVSKAVCLTFLIALLSSVIYMNKTTIQLRAKRVAEELSSYSHGNDHTSLGSRFTLWKTGLIAFYERPFGQTQLHRNEIIKNYLNKNNPHSFALEYIDVHLHNEFIQYASIFGIPGIIILLFFYIVLISDSFPKNISKNPIALISITALLYGLTDLLLTSVEYIVLFSALFIIIKLADEATESEIKKSSPLIKTYIINLPGSKDRLNLMTGQMESLNIPFEIVEGFDGRKIKDEDMFIFKRDVSYAVTKGEVGCALSHLKVYKKLVDSDCDVALVLEDDVIIPWNLKEIISEIAERNGEKEKLVTLLSKVNKYINKPLYELSSGHGVFKTTEATFAHGYIINRKAAKKLLEKLLPVWCVADQWTLLYNMGFVKLQAAAPAILNTHPDFEYLTTITGRELGSTLASKKKCWSEIKKSIPVISKVKKSLWTVFIKPFIKIIKT